MQKFTWLFIQDNPTKLKLKKEYFKIQMQKSKIIQYEELTNETTFKIQIFEMLGIELDILKCKYFWEILKSASGESWFGVKTEVGWG